MSFLGRTSQRRQFFNLTQRCTTVHLRVARVVNQQIAFARKNSPSWQFPVDFGSPNLPAQTSGRVPFQLFLGKSSAGGGHTYSQTLLLIAWLSLLERDSASAKTQLARRMLLSRRILRRETKCCACARVPQKFGVDVSPGPSRRAALRAARGPQSSPSPIVTFCNASRRRSAAAFPPKSLTC